MHRMPSPGDSYIVRYTYVQNLCMKSQLLSCVCIPYFTARHLGTLSSKPWKKSCSPLRKPTWKPHLRIPSGKDTEWEVSMQSGSPYSSTAFPGIDIQKWPNLVSLKMRKPQVSDSWTNKVCHWLHDRAVEILLGFMHHR